MPINFDVVIWHARQFLALKALYTPGIIILDFEVELRHIPSENDRTTKDPVRNGTFVYSLTAAFI